MFLAMPEFVYDKLIEYEFVKEMIKELNIKIVLFNEHENLIVSWKEPAF